MMNIQHQVAIRRVDNGWVVEAWRETKVFTDPEEMLAYVYYRCCERSAYNDPGLVPVRIGERTEKQTEPVFQGEAVE